MLDIVIENTFLLIFSGMGSGAIISVALLCVQQVLHIFEITTK